MNYRLILILLIVVAGLIGWNLSQSSDSESNLTHLVKREGAPEYVGEKITTTVYDLNGKLQYLAEATEIKRFESDERTEFVKPLLDLFDLETSLKQWKISADTAELTKDKMLRLSGNVKLKSIDPTARLDLIETESLLINLNNYDISTNSFVKSKGMGFTTEGIGLIGNLKKQTATLTKDVNTYIEPTLIEQKSTQ